MQETDVVCLKDTTTYSKHSSKYKVRTYYFCSEECKNKFDMNADFYTEEAALGEI